MLRGYRCIVIAAVGWLILAGASEQQNQQGTKAGGDGNSHQPIAPAPVLKPPYRADDSGRNDDRCKGAYSEDKSCNAISANAAVDQAGYSFWQTVAAYLGVVVGLGTLIAAVLAARWAKKAALHTGSGVGEARRAADAAEKALGHAEDTANRQLRAYIGVDSVTVQSWETRKWPVFAVHFTNSGQTPAKEIVVVSKCIIGPTDMDIPENSLKGVKGLTEGNLGSGKNTKSLVYDRRDLTQDDFDQVISLKSCVFIIGVIEYVDIFNNIHHTNFGLFGHGDLSTNGFDFMNIRNDSD